MPKTVTGAARRSIASTIALQSAIKRKTNSTWRIARRASMFTRKLDPTYTAKEKQDMESMTEEQRKAYRKEKVRKPKIRSLRLISDSTFLRGRCGCVKVVRKSLEREAAKLRIPVTPECKGGPFCIGISDSAQAILQHFLISYVQDAGRAAADVRKSLGTSKRIDGSLMRLGFESTNERLFPPLAPRSIFQPEAKKAKKMQLTEQEQEATQGLKGLEKVQAVKKLRAKASSEKQ